MVRINKFNALFGAAAYEPMFLVKRMMADQEFQRRLIRFVKVLFTDVADNDVKVTDDELKAHMQKHSGLFQADQPTRSIE